MTSRPADATSTPTAVVHLAVSALIISTTTVSKQVASAVAARGESSLVLSMSNRGLHLSASCENRYRKTEVKYNVQQKFGLYTIAV